MKIPVQESKTRPQPPQGTHLARVLGVVDLGLRPEWVYMGDTKPAQYQVELTYELVNTEMEPGRPFVTSEMIVNKISKDKESDKITNLTRRIKAFKGSYDDPKSWLGQPCMLTLEPKKNKPEYIKIVGQSGVGPVPEGMPVKPLTNDTYFFDLEDPDMDIFTDFPEWKQEMIKENLEFNGSPLQIALDRLA